MKCVRADCDEACSKQHGVGTGVWYSMRRKRVHICDRAKKINLPEYTVISKEGPDHKPKFTVKLTIRNLLSHTSEGKSIQEAEIRVPLYLVLLMS